MDDDLKAYLYPGSPFLPGIDFGLLNPIIRDMFLEEEYSLGEAIAKGLGLVGGSSAFSALAQIGPANIAEYIKGFTHSFRLLLFVVMLQETGVSDIERAIPLLLAQMKLSEDQFFSLEEIVAAVPLISADPNGVVFINEFVRQELASSTHLYYKVGLEAARQTFLEYIDVLTILVPHPLQEEKQPESLLFQLRSYKNLCVSTQAEPLAKATFFHTTPGTKDVKKDASTLNSYTERNFLDDIQHITELSYQIANSNDTAEQLLRVWEAAAGQQSLEQYTALWTAVYIAFGDFAWQRFLSNREKRFLSIARQAYSRPMKLSTMSKADLGTRYVCAMRLGALYCEHNSELEISPFHLAKAVHDTHLDTLISNERLYQRSAYQFSKQKLQARNDLIAARILEACMYLSEQDKENSASWCREAFMVAEYSKSRMLREEMALAERHQPRGVPSELYEAEKRCLDRLREIYADVTARQYLRFYHPAFLNEFDVERSELRLELEQIWVQMEDFGDEARSYVLGRRDESLQWKGLRWETFQAVSKELGEQFALVSISRLPGHVLFSVLRADSDAPEMCEVPLPQISGKTLDDYLENYSKEILNRASLGSDPTNWWQRLGEILFVPLEPFLDGVKYVYFLPYGDFHNLPLHALTLHGKPFIERWAVAYAPSINVLESTLSRPKYQWPVLVMGYAPPDDLRTRLTETILKEAKDIATHFDVLPVPPEKVDLALLRERGQSSRLIHISCHGVPNEKDPLDAGIWLADGNFTSRHWLQMRLQADLVTLSACLAGRNKVRPGDDLVGLTRAVLFAGASSLLTCLWSVNAKATLEWMLEFYRNIWGNNAVDKITAFQKATLKLQDKYEDPYYWAPFILVGDFK